MIQIVKKKTPNSKIIKKLREAINLSQEEFLSRMKEDLGYTMSRRTYQRIEKGDDVQPKYLDFIIKFFDKQNLKLDIDDLVIEANKKKSAKAIKKSKAKYTALVWKRLVKTDKKVRQPDGVSVVVCIDLDTFVDLVDGKRGNEFYDDPFWKQLP